MNHAPQRPQADRLYAHYTCTPQTFCPQITHPVRWLDPAVDFGLAQAYWRVELTEEMWREAHEALGYHYAAVIEDGRIVSLAAAWAYSAAACSTAAAWELAAVSTNDPRMRRKGYAKSVCSFVTQFILDTGRTATCTTALDNLPMQRTAESLGYQRTGESA